MNDAAIKKHHSITDSSRTLRPNRIPKQRAWATHGILVLLSVTMSAEDISIVGSIDANRNVMLKMNKSPTVHTLQTWYPIVLAAKQL